MIPANFNKRLEKLEAQGPRGKLIYIWMDEGDTEAAARAHGENLSGFPVAGGPLGPSGGALRNY